MGSKALEEIKKLKEELQTLMRTKGELALRERFAEFFKENSNVTAVGWTQYAPHFNDGDACEFGVYDFAVTTNKEFARMLNFDGYGEANTPEEGFVSDYGIEDKNLVKNLNKLRQDVVDDDLFEQIWGGDKKVLAYLNRNGNVVFDSDWHEHD